MSGLDRVNEFRFRVSRSAYHAAAYDVVIEFDMQFRSSSAPFSEHLIVPDSDLCAPYEAVIDTLLKRAGRQLKDAIRKADELDGH